MMALLLYWHMHHLLKRFGKTGAVLAIVLWAIGLQSLGNADDNSNGKIIDPRITGGRIGVGLNFPGAGLRWFPADRYAVEARFQYEKTALVVGPRVCRYVGSLGSLFPYIGLEGDYVRFKDEGVKSAGYAAGAFVGGEVYLRQRFSFQFDFGPVYVSLNDQIITITSGGIGFMLNFGLTYYFGGTGGGE
jgi:hypothetical protein